MPWIAIVIGVGAGLAVWTVLDRIQSEQVDKIFGRELKVQLDLRARESLIRFDRYVASYAATTRLLANHRKLSEYLEPLYWSEDTTKPPVVYKDFRPLWLPDFFDRAELSPPSQVLLTDPKGRVREIFQGGRDPVPAELAKKVPSAYLDAANVKTMIDRFDGDLYLLASDSVEDAGGFDMGYLVVLVPVDDAFMAASQRGLDIGRAAVAIVDRDDHRIRASVDSATLAPDTAPEEWSDNYVITSQPLPESTGSHSHLAFATFVPNTVVERMSRHVRIFERRQRFIAAFVFVAVFTAVIYLVSSRLNKVLKRMTRFSQRALGIPEPGFDRGGNQLLLLEDWIQHFTQLVLTAREEMSRRHQAEMRESEALKAAMMEASLDAIVTLDQAGRIIEFNPAAERVLGLARKEAIGSHFADRFLGAYTHTAFKRMLDRSLHQRQEPLGRGELLVQRPDGIELPVEVSVAPIELEEQRFHTLFIHDISSRKRAEQEIKSLARFASESPNPILRVTADGLIVYANNASRPLLRAWGTETGERLPITWAPEVTLALGTGQPLERETDLNDQVYSLLFAPIRDLGYLNIYARDITAVRRAEQESRQHQAELVHVCRLSTMGEVATGMAHELNQPLSAIVNYANGCTRRLQTGLSQPADLVDAMGHITAQAKRASEIIRRLRALVGKQPPIRAETDLNHLVREVCSFLEFETSRVGIEIELDLAEREIPVRVDLVQIEQVLLNLVGNALDALEGRPAGERRLTLHTATEGATASVAVEDSGPGIEPDRLPTLFDAFVTSKEGGMGMGLAISQTIVENHEGRIWAESELGRGSIFHMTLPLSSPAGGKETGHSDQLETELHDN